MLKHKTSTKNWDDWLETIQSIDDDKCNDKNRTLTKTPPKTAGGENMYVQFVYGPQTICNHTRGQVLVSKNADPVNAVYKKNQQK